MKGIFRELVDHARRVFVAMRGFRFQGAKWFGPWFAYACSPLLSRLFPKRELHFKTFSVRLGDCDIYTFANLFEDYRLGELQRAIQGVDLVIDAGANVGAFCWLVAMLPGLNKSVRIIAVEPDHENCEFLRRQPFANRIELIEGAIGPSDGSGTLRPGMNSVTHSVDFHSDSASHPSSTTQVQVLSLQTLAQGHRTMLKMDIEGGEWAILEHGLPDCVRSMFLEAHPSNGSGSDPRSHIPGGKWQFLSRDIFGCSCWYWENTN
jgi:FkbM family methyltransferase